MPYDTGTILNRRYRVVRLLGQGGFGAVYRAWDIALNRPCALKENLDTSAEAQRQFTREAQILAQLAHPNLPRVTDHFQIPDQGQYLVMDFVEGEDLETLVEREGPVPPAQALRWIAQVADALDYLHNQPHPVLHRDIKPANIRITPDGRAVLVDFGLVKVYDPHLRTTIGARAVTPGYAPPEQYGQGNTDPRTDIYALAATLYKLLTGKDPQESVQRVVDDRLQPPDQINREIPAGVSQSLVQAMSLNPSQRFQTVAAFKRMLVGSQPLAGETVALPGGTAPAPATVAAASPVATGPSASRPQAAVAPSRSRRPLFFGLAGVMIVIVAGAIFASIYRNNQQNDDATASAIAIANETATMRAIALAESLTSDAAALATREAEATIQMEETRQMEATRAAAQAAATQTAQVVAAATTEAAAAATETARETATVLARGTATAQSRESLAALLQANAILTYGPAKGTLLHDEDSYISFERAGVIVRNFITEARFVNPFDASSHDWDYGFIFREDSNGEYRLTVHSDGSWSLSVLGTEESMALDEGIVFDMNFGGGQSNLIKLFVREAQGWLYINGLFVTELDLSTHSTAGDVIVATGLYEGAELAGEATVYSSFTVWSLD